MTAYNLFVYCGNDPVNRVDPDGHAWWHWAIAAAVVTVAAAAVIVTAGGAAPALMAVSLVGNGFAAATTALTIAAGAFIGAATGLGFAAAGALATSSSAQEYANQGNWGTVAATVGGAALGAAAGYASTKNFSEKSSDRTPLISSADAKRIQNAANKTNQTITVVGSRASGTAGLNSDWDYIMSGNSAQRHAAASSVPRGVFGGEYNSGIDIFSSYVNGPNPVMLDRSKPYIEFFPQ